MRQSIRMPHRYCQGFRAVIPCRPAAVATLQGPRLAGRDHPRLRVSVGSCRRKLAWKREQDGHSCAPDGKENPGMALNAIPGFRCVVLCEIVGGFQGLLGFWCGGGVAAGGW